MLFRFIEISILLYSTFMLWRKSEENLFFRWMSACLILIALQRLTSVFQVFTLPYLHATSYPTILIEELQLFIFIVYYSFVVLFPFIILIGWIVFPDVISRSIGAVFFILFFQTIPSLYQNFNWFWLYAAGCLLILILFIGIMMGKKNDGYIHLNRKRTFIAGTISLLLNLFFFYIHNKTTNDGIELPKFESSVLQIHGPHDYFNSIAFLMIFLFVFLASKYGMFGIKLYIEKQRLDSSITAIKSGTAILNHTIKNEIGKIDYLRERIRDRLPKNDINQIEEHLDRMQQVTNHLQQMINRIQDKTGEIYLIKTKKSLHAILKEVMNRADVYLEKKQIQKIEEFDRDVTVICDPTHLQEALLNLCINAVDAMKPCEGVLIIRMILSKRNVTIEIQDNGKGIPKEQFSKIFEPFYTTKNNANHYGLGLSYSHSVIRKHSGTLKIAHSEINQGTTFSISFPRSSFVEEEIG
ncbi:HAMP domain-containing histidine kinase [Bacillus sp. IITD106]|nr:HAMP domain-containing histidine kinase [Bacillus sp. IITD106]